MKTPFNKTFTKEIDNKISDEEILKNFIINLKIKSFTTFNKTENKLLASNDYTKHSFLDNNHWEDLEKVTVKFIQKKRKKNVIYVLDFSNIYKVFKKYYIIIIPSVIVYLYFSGKLDQFIEDFGLFLGILLPVFFVIVMLLVIEPFLLILRHRNIFRNTMRYGAGNIKYYNWDKIMKTKTDKELKEIINGKSNYSDRVIIFAKKEFKKRHSENKNIH